MSRRLILAALLVPALAHADEPAPATAEPTPTTAEPATATTVEPATAPAVATTAEPAASTTAEAAPPDMSAQGIGAELGVATGGRATPGGLRIAGHYLYQLAAQDWFDGIAAFTFGSGSAACFRDRMDTFICDHGLADGDAFELSANVRHFLGGSGEFWPFLRGGVGLAFVRFPGDSVTGLVVPLHAGGGLRVSVSHAVAVTAEGELELGFGAFNHTLGLEPQLGVAITAGAEFRL